MEPEIFWTIRKILCHRWQWFSTQSINTRKTTRSDLWNYSRSEFDPNAKGGDSLSGWISRLPQNRVGVCLFRKAWCTYKDDVFRYFQFIQSPLAGTDIFRSWAHSSVYKHKGLWISFVFECQGDDRHFFSSVSWLLPWKG